MGKLFLLNVENVRGYLELVRFRMPFSIKDIKKIEEVGEYSNNNFLFRLFIRKKGRTELFYIKQAQPYNRRSLLEGKPIAIPTSRAAGEVVILERLESLWGKDVVPHVFWYDHQNRILLMSDVGKSGKFLINEFSDNRVHPELGNKIGKLLGKLHATTYKTRVSAGCDRVYQQYMYRFFFNHHWGYAARRLVSTQRVKKFYQSVEEAPFSIIWGDPVYRNVFVKPNKKISCFDFDHTVKYDPMHDLGVLLSHWIWMWLKGNKKVSQEAEKFLTTCSQAYWREWERQPKLMPPEKSAMLERLPGWMGIYMLSRTDGESGSYFKKWPAWEKRIRQFGIQLIKKQRNSLTSRLRRLILEV